MPVLSPDGDIGNVPYENVQKSRLKTGNELQTDIRVGVCDSCWYFSTDDTEKYVVFSSVGEYLLLLLLPAIFLCVALEIQKDQPSL